MMIYRIVGTSASGRTIQHVLLVHDRHGPRGLACAEAYDESRFFYVADHSEAHHCLAAAGPQEVNCRPCRLTLERDYVFDPKKPRTLVSQIAIACELRDKTDEELEQVLSRAEKGSTIWNAVHVERHRRETGLEY